MPKMWLGLHARIDRRQVSAMPSAKRIRFPRVPGCARDLIKKNMIQLINQLSGDFPVSNAQREAALRDAAVRLIAAQEAERSRLAREIHDDLGQKIAMLSMELWRLGENIKGPESLRRHYQNLQNQVQEISTEVNRLAYKLHPAMLDNVGLLAAMKSLCHEITAFGKLRVEFYHQGSFAELPKDVTLCIFRITQEALRNCMKHSDADSAEAVLLNTGKEVRLSVLDEGRGFDMNRKTVRQGLGLTSMQERLRIVGGKMKINSRPSHGTRIEVSIPLSGESCFLKRDRRKGGPVYRYAFTGKLDGIPVAKREGGSTPKD